MKDQHNPAQQSLDAASVRIGHQVRDLRKSKNMTLQQMADAIDRSVGYVSQVERGVSNLPIPILQRISEALGVKITWFFHSETPQALDELGHVVRSDSRRELRYLGTGIREELLSPGLSGDLLLLLTTLAPLAVSDPEPRKRRGEEAGFVRSGQLCLTIGAQVFNLREGDSFSIAKDETYQVQNPSTEHDAVVVWVITPPNY